MQLPRLAFLCKRVNSFKIFGSIASTSSYHHSCNYRNIQRSNLLTPTTKNPPCLMCSRKYYRTSSSCDDVPQFHGQEKLFDEVEDSEGPLRLEYAQEDIGTEVDADINFAETDFKGVLQENDISAEDLLDLLITKHDVFDRQKIIYCLVDLLKIANHNLAADNSALLAIGIKMLALIHAQGTALGQESSLEISKTILAYFREHLHKITDQQEKAIMKLFLDACEGNFNLVDQKLTEGRMWDVSDCFHILAAIAIRKGKLEELRKLSLEMAPGQTFFSHASFPAYNAMMEVLQKANDEAKKKTSGEASEEKVDKKEVAVKDLRRDSDSVPDQLLTIFIEQLRLQEEAITQGQYAVFVKPAIKQHPSWRVFTTKPMPEHTCELCYEPTKATEPSRHTSLPSPRLLTNKEHILLQKEIKKFLLKQAGNKSKDVREQCTKLEEKLKEMKDGSSYDRKQGKRPLIMDGMHMLNMDKSKTNRKYLVEEDKGGKWTFKSIFKFVLATMEVGYSPVMVIFKKGQVDKEQAASLDWVGVKHFIYDASPDPDLFVLNAALMYGPEAHLLANDLYLESHADGKLVKSLNSSTLQLLATWCKTSQIRFSKKLKTYELPCDYAAPILKDDYGYHICLSRNFRHMRWTDNIGGIKCIRTAHLPGNAKERSKKKREARQKLVKEKEAAARKLIHQGEKGKNDEIKDLK